MKEIEKKLMEILIQYLETNYCAHYTYEAFNYDAIEIYAFSKKKDDEKTVIIRIGMHHDFRQIYIPNIFMPDFLKHKRIGKTLIRIIYEFGRILGYNVFVVQLTDSFRDRLLRRGAITTNEYDILQIVENTNLTNPEN